MPTITRFEDLDCWQQSVALATEIYEISSEGEFAIDFGFRDQLRRAAVSISSNIAEGKERETVNEFVRFLYIAKGSAGELRTHLYVAENIGYLKRGKAEELREKAERISAMIGSLIKTLKTRRK
ncbi:MAG: four helix bundle protein [Deltaproteobacteria bacterium]|nr:four helix bundle protein [Deltaproteobacteria bacterium]